MGAVSFSIDKTLVAHLKQSLSLPIFVETGSFEGESIAQVLPLFEQIYSVELSQDYYQKTAQRFQGNTIVQLHHDRSEHFLRHLQPTLHSCSVLYWLDAHWCVADETAGEESQCPLLEELAAIGSLNSESVILIDDARLFLCTPPAPHRVAHWPGLDAILRKLFELSATHEVMVVNDVIAYYPTAIRSTMQAYAYQYSIDWLEVLGKLRYFEYLAQQSRNTTQGVEELATAAEERLRLIQTQSQEIAQKDQSIRDLVAAAEERLQVIQAQAQEIARKDQAIEELATAAEERLQLIQTQAQEIAQLECTIEQLQQEQKQRIQEIRHRKRETVQKLVRTTRTQQELIRDQTEQIGVLKRVLESTVDRRLRRQLSKFSRFFN